MLVQAVSVKEVRDLKKRAFDARNGAIGEEQDPPNVWARLNMPARLCTRYGSPSDCPRTCGSDFNLHRDAYRQYVQLLEWPRI